ncbi:MAG: hypothetical protein ACTS6J_16960 [Burkholderiales bacterium]
MFDNKGSDMSSIDINDPVQVGMHLAELKGSMASMQQQQTHNAEVARTAIDGVNTRLDGLSKKVDDITSLSGSTVSHTEQLGRMWDTVSRTDKLAEGLKNMAIGGMFVLTLTGGMAAYLYNGDKDAALSGIERNDDRLDRIEAYLAGPRDQPFKR